MGPSAGRRSGKRERAISDEWRRHAAEVTRRKGRGTLERRMTRVLIARFSIARDNTGATFVAQELLAKFRSMC
jgi:hypothetical protein